MTPFSTIPPVEAIQVPSTRSKEASKTPGIFSNQQQNP